MNRLPGTRCAQWKYINLISFTMKNDAYSMKFKPKYILDIFVDVTFFELRFEIRYFHAHDVLVMVMLWNIYMSSLARWRIFYYTQIRMSISENQYLISYAHEPCIGRNHSKYHTHTARTYYINKTQSTRTQRYMPTWCR